MGRPPKVSRKKFCSELLLKRTGNARYYGIEYLDASGIDLSCLDMRGITFKNINFSHTNLRGANMQDATFRNCTFTYASMKGTNISGTKFLDCDLKFASFDRAKAFHSLFNRCDLTSALFLRADVTDANFDCSNLDKTNFNSAQMSGADLDCAFNTENIKNGIPFVCPEKGGFIAYKQCVEKCTGWEIVVELYIPASAKRTSSTSRKCRASAAKVKGFYWKSGKQISKEEAEDLKVVSHHNPRFKYKIGETVVPDHPFDENRWHECSSGIHFFLTFEEAARY